MKPSKTVNDGTYPLSRPLFIYVNADDAEKQPALEAFVNFYLSKEFTPVVATPEVGYVELTDQQYQGVRQRFESGRRARRSRTASLTSQTTLGANAPRT